MVAIVPESDQGLLPVRSGVFGSGTAIRFALLVLFIAAGGTWLWSYDYTWLWEVAAHPRGDQHDWLMLCPEAVGVDPSSDSSQIGSTARAFIRSCKAAHGIPTMQGWMIAGTAVVFLLALFIYVFSPLWRRRRGRLLRIDLQSGGDLAEQLRELVATAGLRRPPEFVLDPRPGAASAVVFGRLGRYTVCLDAGLVVHGGMKPDVLRTVVLHELAHIRNRDVDITYLTVALWRSFLLCVVLPHIALTIYPFFVGPYSHTVADFWRHAWRYLLKNLVFAGVLTAGTYLARSDILRTREFYADADAAHLTGPASMHSGQQRQPHVQKRGVWQRFLGLWRTHPTWPERSRSLEDRASLFTVTAMPMLLTGVTAVVANHMASSLFEDFGPSSSFLATDTLPTLLTAVLIVGIAGVLLWRAVAYAVLTGRAVPSGLNAGLWLGTGIMISELATFAAAGNGLAGNGLLPRHPEVLLLFDVAVPAFTWWTAQSAELWIRRWPGRSLRPVQLLGLTAGLFVFGIWYHYWMSDGASWFLLNGPPVEPPSPSTSISPWFEFLSERVVDPVVFVGAVVFVMFPVAACLWRPVTEPARWACRAGWVPRDDAAPRDLPPMRIAAIGAVAGGVLCCLAIITAAMAMHMGMPVRAKRDPAWRMGLYRTWLTFGLTAAITLTAAAVAAIARRQRLTLALAASGGATLIGLIFLLLLASIDGCDGPLRVMTSVCKWRPRGGWYMTTVQVPFVLGLDVLAAAMGALVGAASTDLTRKYLGRSPRVDTVARGLPDSMIARRLAVLTACTLTAVLIAGTQANLCSIRTAPRTDTPIPADAAQTSQDAVRVDVGAWLEVGGHDILAAFNDGLGQSGDSLDAILTSVADAADNAGQSMAPTAADRMRRVCGAMSHLADKANSFASIPDPVAQAAWTTALTNTTRASTDCLHSTQSGSDSTLLTAAAHEIVEASNALDMVIQRLASDRSHR